MLRDRVIVLTVPHASCPRTLVPGHPCDTGAEDAARMLHARLAPHVEVLLNVARRHRVPELGGIDMNRHGSRETPFRQQILADIQHARAQGREAWVVDVHSFPPAAAAGVELFPGDPDIALLDVPPRFPPYGRHAAYVQDALRIMRTGAQELNVTLVHGDERNDIIITSRAQGARSLLVEFNERLDTVAFRAHKQAAVERLVQWMLA